MGVEDLGDEGIFGGLSDVGGYDLHEIAEIVFLVLVVALFEVYLFLHVLNLDAVGQTLHDLLGYELAHVGDDLQCTFFFLVAGEDAVL